MQELRYNIDNQIVCLGPFLANSDGDTEQNSLTIANTDILIYKEGATSLVAKNSGGATLMSDGKYYCTLDSTDTNTRGYFEINIHMGGSLYLVFKGQVVNQNYYDAKYGDDYLQVDTVEVSGTIQTANDNGADINSILTAVGNLAVGSGGIATVADEFTKSGSEVETNSYLDTQQENGTLHIVEPDASTTDIDYGFNVTNAGIPQSIEWMGYAQSQGDDYAVYFYNWMTDTWDQVGTINGANGTTLVSRSFTATISHVGTGSNVGRVRLRFYSTNGTAIATDRIICVYTLLSQGIQNGSTITLDASTVNKNYIGHNWNLALGGQEISGSYFYQSVNVTGIGTCSNGLPYTFQECAMKNATLSVFGFLKECVITAMAFTSTSGVEEDTIDIFGGESGVAGAGAPTLDFSAVTKTTNVQLRKWSGGCTCIFTSDCVASLEVINGGTLTITTGGGDIEIRGMPKSVIVNSSGTGTTNVHGVIGPITINGTGGTVNIYGVHNTITDNSLGTVTINDNALNSPDVDAIKVVTDILSGLYENVSGYRFTEKSLEQAPSGTGGDATSANQTTIINHLTSIKDNASGSEYDPATDSLKEISDVQFSVDDIFNKVVEGSYTFLQFIRGIGAALAGNLAGAGTTTVEINDVSGTKIRIRATVDENGNRTITFLDLD